MKRKARIQAGIDDRLVAIYARKSRITNKGDSIGVQFKQSADYAVNQLSLPEDYEFIQYEDKGLSGYYSDRPDFQRLLRDVEMGKIKAVACYKLDRISRKTSDLMRLLEYFERHDVTLLVCSNNINTQISTSKIIIQVLAIIAEFERDILTERIQDNLMELAKDGRWLGGKTPTGFSSKRVTTGSGKNKSAISFLVPIEEEKEIVLEIYRTFWETRSLLQTANLISEKYETKHGAKFTTSTIRLILRNPIYCVADEYSYNYFLEHDGNLFGEAHEFDGKHGLSAYNKTDQMKVEDEDSTFFNPKFSQLLTKKPISEWIVSVGRHEGFISSRKWVETQNMLDEIAEKYNRPHRKTNALLSGLMYCPICGKRLRVLPESNRWTNGKPRFKYACPGVRAKECTFKGVEGVTLDEFVIHSLSSLQEEHSDYYRQLLENRVASMIRTDQGEKEYQETKKAIERLNADIAAQVRNLREADDALKRFIQDDIKVLTDDLAKREADLRRIENTQSENHYLIHELNSIKKRLLSFEEFAKDAQPETLFTLVHSIVDRIYITTDGSTQKCQVYIKGCATEDYSDILGAAEYIDGKFLLPVATYMPPMCDLDKYSIVPEQHKDGSWHFHGLVNGLPECELHQFVIGDKMGKKIADKVKKGETVYNWLSYSEKFGFCSLEPIKDIERCGVYITKYLTKDINAMKSVRELGEHLYFHSKGLNKALVLKKGYCFDIPTPDYINEYVAVSWHDYSELNDLLARFIKHEHVLAGRYRTAHKILNPVSKLDFLISKANECGIPVFSV